MNTWSHIVIIMINLVLAIDIVRRKLILVKVKPLIIVLFFCGMKGIFDYYMACISWTCGVCGLLAIVPKFADVIQVHI